MITVYRKNDTPTGMQVIELNDVFFNKHTAEKLDDRAKTVIAMIDHSEMINKFTIRSAFDGSSLNIDKLSTGCKTILNIIYHPDTIFDISECGENAVEYIYSLESGNICCSYPLIAFDMNSVHVYSQNEITEITSYDELKEWWQNEN